MNCCSTILLIRQLEVIRVGLNLGMLPLSLQKKIFSNFHYVSGVQSWLYPSPRPP